VWYLRYEVAVVIADMLAGAVAFGNQPQGIGFDLLVFAPPRQIDVVDGRTFALTLGGPGLRIGFLPASLRPTRKWLT